MASLIYTNPNFVYEKMVHESINRYTVSNQEGGNIYEEEDSGTENVAVCVDNVKNCINNSQGVLKVILRKQPKKGAREGGDNKTGIFTFFINTLAIDRYNINKATPPPSPQERPKDDYHNKWYLAQIENLNQKHEYERRLYDKEQEIKLLKENNKDDLAEKYLPTLIDIFTKKQTTTTAVHRGIAGAQDGNPQPSENTIRVRRALSRLSKLDSDLPGTIEVVADFAERDAEKYHATISALKAGLI